MIPIPIRFLRQTSSVLATLAVLLALFPLSARASQGPGDHGVRPTVRFTGRVIVKFKPDHRNTRALEALTGGRGPGTWLRSLGVQVLRPTSVSTTVALGKLRRNAGVEWASPEVVMTAFGSGSVTPNDPYYSSQWGLGKIRAPGGWGIYDGPREVKVAIVDSGIDPTHPDLRAHVYKGCNFVVHASDVLCDPSDYRDAFGHGTHVAGIAAATGDNGIGVAGVSWNVRLLVAKVLDKNGQGTDTNVSQGIVWSANNGASVINLSLGSYYDSKLVADAVKYAQRRGALVVAAAGNDSSDYPSYPAALPGVVGVAATTPSDTRASFSNYGSDVDISAPGTHVLSTTPTYRVALNEEGVGRGYGYLDGTSMATPFVTGAAALLKAEFPGYTASELWRQLRAGADDLGTAGWDKYTGYGRLDLSRTLGDHLSPVVSGLHQSFVIGSQVNPGSVPVRVSWSGYDHGTGISAYRVQQSTDGNPWSWVTSSTTGTSVVRRLAPGHLYRFRAAAVDRAGNRGGWDWGPSFHLDAYQETSGAIAYSSGWQLGGYYPSLGYGGRMKYTRLRGATARMSFTGRAVAWVSWREPGSGSASVLVSGARTTTVNLYQATSFPRRVVYARWWPSSSGHSLTIQGLGTSGHPRVDVDAVLVMR